MKLNEQQANKVYDILVNVCGANERQRSDFLYYVKESQNRVEFRFGGHLGFGGKFWCNTGFLYYDKGSRVQCNTKLYVNCYPEDSNELRQYIINKANEQLSKI